MIELIIKVDDDFLREAKLKGMEKQFELVRCKDCKHWHQSDYCTERDGLWYENDYCSYGERGEADDES